MFWIEKFRPSSLDEVQGQERVTEILSMFAKGKNLPHLLISGPQGTGKTVSVEAALRELYGETWTDNVTIFHTADLMEQGRSYLETDETFVHLYKPDESFLSNLKRAINTYASIRPINAEFKVLWFEDAHTLSHDVQHALRRTMERYSATCRFVFCTTHASSVIPPSVHDVSPCSSPRSHGTRSRAGLYPSLIHWRSGMWSARMNSVCW